MDTYHDAAISGASMILRPGIQALLRDTPHGRFDVVLGEALDRISRGQTDVATLFKHLRFAGVQIVTLPPQPYIQQNQSLRKSPAPLCRP